MDRQNSRASAREEKSIPWRTMNHGETSSILTLQRTQEIRRGNRSARAMVELRTNGKELDSNTPSRNGCPEVRKTEAPRKTDARKDLTPVHTEKRAEPTPVRLAHPEGQHPTPALRPRATVPPWTMWGTWHARATF